ncbi:MAG: hypothetical protein Kow0080_35850 [Candidatus Promineifilaceae bacterium]
MGASQVKPSFNHTSSESSKNKMDAAPTMPIMANWAKVILVRIADKVDLMFIDLKACQGAQKTWFPAQVGSLRPNTLYGLV